MACRRFEICPRIVDYSSIHSSMRFIHAVILIAVCGLMVRCSNKSGPDPAELQTDSASTREHATPGEISGTFSGEYLIGDGGAIIYPVGDTYEMRNKLGETYDVLYFEGREHDTLSVYSNKDKSVIFKMNPDHKFGMHYEPDEAWPVSWMQDVPAAETEVDETDRVMRLRYFEDSVAYAQLVTYDGTYQIQTESEGVNATLSLHYNGDRTFTYDWNFVVDNEEIQCNGSRKGLIAMDRTQHGVDVKEACLMHVNFNGNQDGGYVVEIDFEDQSKCDFLTGECAFSGTYLKGS